MSTDKTRAHYEAMAAEAAAQQAFPLPVAFDPNGHQHTAYPGMSLRDYFAAKVLEGSCANAEFLEVATSSAVGDGSAWDRLSKVCYRAADAMLLARIGSTP